MKKQILTLALVGVSAVASFAQGTIQFSNSGLNSIKYVDAPGVASVPAPLGTVVGVYWGRTADALSLQANTTVINTTAGVFNGGAVYGLNGTAPGETVFLKIGAWLNKGGQTPATIPSGAASPGITHYGESATVQTTALGPVAGPGTVVWQSASGTSVNRAKPFDVVPVPEPSVMALGALGLGALLLRRRKA